MTAIIIRTDTLDIKTFCQLRKEARPKNYDRFQKLHEKNGFKVQDGWILKIWSRELTIEKVTAEHKVYYLIHEVTGHVFTSQVKAWNDTVRMVLWFDLVIWLSSLSRIRLVRCYCGVTTVAAIKLNVY